MNYVKPGVILTANAAHSIQGSTDKWLLFSGWMPTAETLTHFCQPMRLTISIRRIEEFRPSRVECKTT